MEEEERMNSIKKCQGREEKESNTSLELDDITNSEINLVLAISLEAVEADSLGSF